MTIAQIEPIAVIFTAPEDQLPDIKAALAAGSPKTIALSTDGKRVLSTGTLALINNQVDTSSGTIRLKAVFDNKDHALWPGQSVSTRLLIATLKDATVVPDDAVQHGPNGLYAYTVNKENKAELRKIKVTRSIDGRSVVDEGLSPGRAGDHGRPVQGSARHAGERRRSPVRIRLRPRSRRNERGNLRALHSLSRSAPR